MDSSDATSRSTATQRLIDYLITHGIEHKLLEPGMQMPTVPLAAAAIGVAEEQIIKSLVFCDANGECVLVIASGPTRIDRVRLADATGLVKPRLADPETVLALTGFPAGGVSPVGHETPIPVVIDRRAADLPIVYGGGGAEELLLRIRPVDVIRLTGAAIVEITIPT